MKQVNFSARLRFLVYTIIVCKQQNLKSGMQPLMAEEKDMRKSRRCLDSPQKDRERKGGQKLFYRKL